MFLSYLKYYLFNFADIQESHTQEEKDQIYRFRYKIFNEECKMIEKYDHESKILKDDMDGHPNSFNAYTKRDGSITSACRFHYSNVEKLEESLRTKYAISELPLNKDDMVSFTERFAIERSLRGKYIAIATTIYISKRSIKDLNCYLSFSTCAPALLKYYMTLGFRPYTTKLQQYNDRVELPVAVIPDMPFLERYNTPNYPLMKKHCPKDLKDRFENYNLNVMKELFALMTVEEILDKHAITKRHKSFLCQLRPETLLFLIKQGFFMKIKKGMMIYNEKEHHQEKFLVLEGGLYETKSNIKLISLYPGDIFGEFGSHFDHYKRFVSVYAEHDSIVLVLPRNIASQLMRFNKELYKNFMESYLQSIADREKKLITLLIKHAELSIDKPARAA